VTVGWDGDPAVATWPGLPPLPGDTTADACVIGLGGSGLAAVVALVERGLSVVGVDAGRVVGGAAGRNGGFLVGGAPAYLHTAIELWGEAAAVPLYRATLIELARLAVLLGPEIVRPTGSLRLAGLPGQPASDAERADRAAELVDCARHAAALRRYDFAVEDYDGPLGQGLYLPEDAATNPARRALGLATALAPSAALHEQTPVTRIESGRVTTGRGVISAGVVIVAVDGRLEVLLPELAGRVRTARVQMVGTAPVPVGRLPCPVYGRWGFDYAQQGPDGRLVVGGGRDLFFDEEWSVDTDPTPDVQGYLDGLAARMAGQPVTVTHRWARSVGYTPDGRPLCVPVADRVVAIGGYNGAGNLIGPVAARAAVALALDGTTPQSAFTSTLG
jgi:gamma-glutamylputrescine oxidase